MMLAEPTGTWHLWHVVVSLLGGAGVQRVLTDVARAMPPLPPDSPYLIRWGYASIQAITGHDTNGNAPKA